MQARPALGVEAGYRTPFARQMPGKAALVAEKKSRDVQEISIIGRRRFSGGVAEKL
jgi:hypothetical protein